MPESFNASATPVYDADSRRENYLMINDQELIGQVKKEFGEAAYNADGSLDRKHIGEAAFGDPDKFKKCSTR